MVVESPQLLSPKLYKVSFQDPYLPLKPILALSSRNGIYMLEFDSLHSTTKHNPPMTFKKKWLWNPLQLLSSKLYKVSFQDRYQPLQLIFAFSSGNGIDMLEFDSLQTAIKLNPPMSSKTKWLWNPLQLLSSKLYLVSFQDPSQPLKPILALSSRNGIYMMEFDSLQTAIKLNPPKAFENKWLWNPVQLFSSKLY